MAGGDRADDHVAGPALVAETNENAASEDGDQRRAAVPPPDQHERASPRAEVADENHTHDRLAVDRVDQR